MDGCPHRSCGIGLKRFRCGESFDVLCVMRVEIAGLISDESDDHDVNKSAYLTIKDFYNKILAKRFSIRPRPERRLHHNTLIISWR